jgi:hypothetical protein
MSQPGDVAGSRVARTAYTAFGIGTVVMFAVGIGICLAVGTSFVDALGVGAFVAIWGGPGFGGMAAGIMYTSREEARRRAEEAAPVTVPPSPGDSRPGQADEAITVPAAGDAGADLVEPLAS